MNGRYSTSPIDRLMAHVVMAPGPMPTDCWLSTYRQVRGGYTHVWVEKRLVYAHRFSYEYHIGPIPDGFDIDHLCRVPNCCNPAHLEPVTPRENMLRSNHSSAITYRTNVCRRGHSMDDAYLWSGRRNCRLCALGRAKATHPLNSPPQ